MTDAFFKKTAWYPLCSVPDMFCHRTASGGTLLCIYQWRRDSLRFSNFVNFFHRVKIPLVHWYYSLVTAVTVTACCTLVAYPVAYILARSDIKKKNVLLVLFIAPMWINFTLRVVALKEVLTMVEGNLAYHPFLNTVLGMTYDFLPFMILSAVHHTWRSWIKAILEAAADLGARSGD